MMKSNAKLPVFMIVGASAVLAAVSVACAGSFFASSNSRDNESPAKQKEMMALVLEWGRVAPFPASATNISLKTEGGSFTRSFRAGFTAPKQDIESWIKDSLGLGETTPDDLSSNKLRYVVTPGGGANWAEVTIDYGLNQVEIYVSWS